MVRVHSDWLASYVKWASVTEAPRSMHFWSGVSAIAGALRRHVWLDMKRWVWHPNFYVLFVADPGIVSKTTTMNAAMDLLKEVPGIHFGPKVITWQDLVVKFSQAREEFVWDGKVMAMSPLTLASGELGNLIDPRDPAMMDAYITLWDGEKVFDKSTKTNGAELVDSPWINLIGCTTPSWISENMPARAIGGGFVSRCVFVYAEEKEKYVPWVDEAVALDDGPVRQSLLQDLERISTLIGPFHITREARDWFAPLYEGYWKESKTLSEDMAKGYVARKQTHLCKLGMVLSVSRGDSLTISLEDLQLAYTMLQALEPQMAKVFAKVGRSEESVQADKIIAIVKTAGKLPYEEICRMAQAYFPGARNLEEVLKGAILAGLLSRPFTEDGKMMMAYTGPV